MDAARISMEMVWPSVGTIRWLAAEVEMPPRAALLAECCAEWLLVE